MIDAIYHLGRVFRENGLEEPEAIHLSNSEQGHRFMYYITKNTLSLDPCWEPRGKHVIFAGEDWLEIEVTGLKVRWPAQFYMKPSGLVEVF